jgi:ribosomal protein S18 acetylase RimI-like enzyme
MEIVARILPEAGEKAALDSLVADCAAHDGSADLEMEKSLNAHPDMRSLFLAYEGGSLVSALSIFAPRRVEAELSGLTSHATRRSGHFSALLAAAEDELLAFGYSEELFVVPEASEAGKSAAFALGARYDFSEYGMRYRGKGQLAGIPGLRVERLGIDSIPALVELRRGDFGETREETEAFERATFAASNRQVYGAFMEGRLVGACSLGFEGDAVSLNGLVVDASSRGRGYGQALLGAIVSLLEAEGLEILLDVNSENENALHIYRKAGFSVIEAMGYYRRSIPRSPRIGRPT